MHDVGGPGVEGLDERAIRAGYQQFKAVKAARELAKLAAQHGLPMADLEGFVDAVLERLIFDGEQLTELLAPLEPGMQQPPHPMVPGTTDEDYYLGNVTGNVTGNVIGTIAGTAAREISS